MFQSYLWIKLKINIIFPGRVGILPKLTKSISINWKKSLVNFSDIYQNVVRFSAEENFKQKSKISNKITKLFYCLPKLFIVYVLMPTPSILLVSENTLTILEIAEWRNVKLDNTWLQFSLQNAMWEKSLACN